MLSKKWILTTTSLIILTVISVASEANHHWNLLEGYVYNPAEFKEREMGKKIVYWHQRKLGEAMVEKDYIVFQFDTKTQELVDVKGHWRDDLPPALPEVNITKEQAESMIEGTVQFSRLYILSPESTTFLFKPTPENPCWVVTSIDGRERMIVTVIDAVETAVLGYGAPPPYTAFSLSGPAWENPCRQHAKWTGLYEDARDWFDTMGYSTEANEWPTENKVKSHIQSKTTAMFYELAHGGSTYFKSGCDHDFYEYTLASEIEDWIGDYTKMPFSFLASCEAMCDTNDNTLSYEFRKGSMEDTATVGYYRMPDCNTCWDFWIEGWQSKFFECMNDGNTVKEAFDQANWDYEPCADCMRFAGDQNFAVVPVVWRVAPPLFDLEKVDDVNDGSSVLPGEEITYTIIYGPNGYDHNNVVITDYLPLEVTYEYIDWSTFAIDANYDPNNHTYTWEIGSLDANDPNDSVTLTVKVNEGADPNGVITNYCEIESDSAFFYATADTNVGSWQPDSEIIYVDSLSPCAPGTGMSWRFAYRDLQDALERAAYYGSEIWVAERTYKPTYINDTGARLISFELLDDVAVYGGFPTGGGAWFERNPATYETILSGDIGTPNDLSDNSYHVVKCQDVNNAILDGFTITAGKADFQKNICMKSEIII